MFPHHNFSTVGGSPFDGHRLPCAVTVSTEDGGIGALTSNDNHMTSIVHKSMEKLRCFVWIKKTAVH